MESQAFSRSSSRFFLIRSCRYQPMISLLSRLANDKASDCLLTDSPPPPPYSDIRMRIRLFSRGLGRKFSFASFIHLTNKQKRVKRDMKISEGDSNLKKIAFCTYGCRRIIRIERDRRGGNGRGRWRGENRKDINDITMHRIWKNEAVYIQKKKLDS